MLLMDVVIQKKALKYAKKLILSLDFVYNLPRDPLTGGDVEIDVIKAHLYDDYISIELWSTFYIHDSIQ